MRCHSQRGARGHGVHLMQMAFLDLNFSMPGSTGFDYSPDGIFGDETAAIVKQFQRDNKLKDDGIVGRLTLDALDRKFPTHSHRANLHFRSLAITNVAFSQILADTERVYNQYGIRINMANGQSLRLKAIPCEFESNLDSHESVDVIQGMSWIGGQLRCLVRYRMICPPVW